MTTEALKKFFLIETLLTYNAVFVSGIQGLPGGSDTKESACNAGDPGSIPGLARSPGEGNGTHSSILALRIPWAEGPSPWGHKELDYYIQTDKQQGLTI